eukprot:CAMPEP_0114243168 /NCGR_PEP_ID=MMETSP0058-20121206/10633_1 /TAXON_ID=36894 /ORGANISM="Pyramimonas parkeae, CCMP726" /LENGTH=240 /DNA_ID=CAMNT_0001355965 /DNA_START=105 /DNA_END=827 /DNA_ORIENTATION=-
MKTAFSTAWLAVLMLLFTSCIAAVKLNETSDFQACLRNPSSCTGLSMVNNQYTGSVPTELGALTRLTTFHFGDNQLTGTLPTELLSLTQLRWMGFYNNNLTGTVMSELGMLTGLTRIQFQYNQLTGTLPSELRAITGVELLVCQNARLCGDIPAGMTLFSDYTCPNATGGTLLGSACPSSAPTASPSAPPTIHPIVDAGEQPLKDNWFRKRDVARQKAFPQKFSWFRKQAKLEADENNAE